MKSSVVVASLAVGLATDVSPLQKTIQMLNDLEAKIIKEGEEAQTEYEEYSEWCEDRSKELGFEIKTGKSTVEELKATILSETTKASELETQIEELAASIASDEKDLAAATKIRNQEAADFAAEEKELVETIDMVERAIAILERELNGGASMMQLQGATSMQQALEIMVKASAFSAADASRLQAFVQTTTDEDDDDSGAPDAAVYQSKSGGIIDTMTALLDKAKDQLNGLRGKEMMAKNNYQQLKQSLEDSIKYNNQDKDAAAKGLSASAETKATAEGDLEVTTKDLSEDIKSLSELHQDCMSKATTFEAEVTARGEELKALGQAEKAIKDMSMGADALTFLQVNSNSLSLTSRTDLANYEAVRYIKDLARKQNSAALAQLASRMTTAMKLGGSAGEDPFAKVKSMVKDMLDKLEKEMAEAADLNAWCEKEKSESNAKKDDITADKEKLTTKLDQATADTAKLKEEVATLQQELAELARTQAEMDDLRAKEKATYEKVQPELEMGLKGVKLALKILNDYYSKAGKQASSGGGSGIIGMLEVVESDFSKNLAQVEAVEQEAAETYERETKENALAKTTKEQDIKYKTKEYTALDKAIKDYTSDLEGVQTELDAVLDYLKSLQKKCTYKVPTYAEKVAAREAEIDGLKEALSILDSAASFVQKSSSLRSLRGVHKHH